MIILYPNCILLSRQLKLKSVWLYSVLIVCQLLMMAMLSSCSLMSRKLFRCPLHHSYQYHSKPTISFPYPISRPMSLHMVSSIRMFIDPASSVPSRNSNNYATGASYQRINQIHTSKSDISSSSRLKASARTSLLTRYRSRTVSNSKNTTSPIESVEKTSSEGITVKQKLVRKDMNTTDVSQASKNHVKVSEVSQDDKPVNPSTNGPIIKSLDEIEYDNKLQELRKINGTKKITILVEEYLSQGLLSPSMLFQAIRTLQKLNRADLSLSIVRKGKELFTSSTYNYILHKNSTLIYVKECCKMGLMDDAAEIFDNCPLESQLALYPELFRGYAIMKNCEMVANVLQKYYQTLCDVFPSALNQSIQQTDKAAKDAVRPLEKDLVLLILKTVLRENGSTSLIVKTIDVLLALSRIQSQGDLIEDYNIFDDYESMQLIASHYLKFIEFIKGAVSMPTLPMIPNEVLDHLTSVTSVDTNKPKGFRPEIAFIGRSNVGKSSLINMICNRKNLAYTSKTPGKTSEFNYFAAFGGSRSDSSKSAAANGPQDGDIAMAGSLKQGSSGKRSPTKRDLANSVNQAKETAIAQGMAKRSAMTVGEPSTDDTRLLYPSISVVVYALMIVDNLVDS